MTSPATADSVYPPMDSLADFARKEQFLEENHNLFTEPQFNWWVRNRNQNGLAESGAVILASRKIYIHRRRFTKWFTAQTR